jgi:hypothetical protein
MIIPPGNVTIPSGSMRILAGILRFPPGNMTIPRGMLLFPAGMLVVFSLGQLAACRTMSQMTRFSKITPIAAILLVTIFGLSSFGQTVPMPSDSASITEKEKTEIRGFTKEFIAQLQKTRDVRPLARKYLVKDFDLFVYDYLLDVEDSEKEKIDPLSIYERRRLAVASLNWMSVAAPWTLLGGDIDENLPKSLRKSYARVTSGMDDDQKLMVKRSTRLRFIRWVETAVRETRTHFRRHPIEHDKRYLAEVRKRENIDDYNYSVVGDIPEPNGVGHGSKWLREHPHSGTYLVGTPIGLGIGVIHIKDKYKILYLLPWPISYDSRLGN